MPLALAYGEWCMGSVICLIRIRYFQRRKRLLAILNNAIIGSLLSFLCYAFLEKHLLDCGSCRYFMRITMWNGRNRTLSSMEWICLRKKSSIQQRDITIKISSNWLFDVTRNWQSYEGRGGSPIDSVQRKSREGTEKWACTKLRTK